MLAQQPSQAFTFSFGLNEESITSAQSRLAEEFNLLEEGSERYDYLISLGRSLAPMPNDLKIAANHLSDCRGDAWLAGGTRDGLLYLTAAAESDMVAGILAIVVDIYSGRSPEDVLSHPIDAKTLGLSSCLSPHRLACFQHVGQRLRNLAMLSRVQNSN